MTMVAIESENLSQLGLDELAERARGEAAAGAESFRNALSHYVEVGKLLCEAKRRMKLPDFDAWVSERVGIGRAHAYNYMLLARNADVVMDSPPGTALRTVLAGLRSSREPREIHPDVAIASITVRHGVSLERAAELVAITTCEVCGRTEDLVTDHDHATGEIRGRLCRSCNRILTERLTPDECRRRANVLMRLAEYMERTS